MSFVPPRRPAGPALLAFLGYALLALLFVWPLPAQLSNRITGDPAGDAGAYVWNAYVFSYNLATGLPLFSTDRILAFTREASLALHNNSLILSALASPLIPALGVVASFNVALILVLILNPFCAYLLARYETNDEAPSWIAGALFGFSPFLSARLEGHMSLATAFGLPLVLLAARRAMRVDTRGAWAFVGMALAVCAASDPYYLVFGVLGVGVVWSFERVAVERIESPNLRWLMRGAAALTMLSLSAVLWILVTGGGRLSIGPINVGVRGLYTPILILTLGVAGVLFAWRPLRFTLESGALRTLRRPALGGLVAMALLFPWLRVAAVDVVAKRGTEAPLWRSSPQGVDLLAFFMPNPTHPLMREIVEPWMARERADAFVEGVASWTVIGILLMGFLALFRRGVVPRFWVVCTSVFAALALGPFIVVGGVDTYVPGPWALLRFVPGIGMVRSPTRFAVMAMLGVAVVTACLLSSARLGRRRGWALLGIGLALGLETFGPPRRLFRARLPERYELVAADRCDVAVLRLPTGIKDGTRERGHFSSRDQFRQALHGKRLVGGYLSRVDDHVVEAYNAHPTLNALLDLSEGKSITPEARALGLKEARTLSRKLGLGFIALDKTATSEELRDFVHQAFEPVVVHKAWPFVIAVPFGENCADGACGHRPGCAHRVTLRL
jgi:membrane protein YdbS with pleckstrin-like domain